MFGIELNQAALKKLAEETIVQARTFFTYLFLPLSIPLLFLQETYVYLKEITGFGKRCLEGKVVLITGASSGIGESLAKLFFNAGCNLILASRRVDELERVKSELVRLKTSGPVLMPAVHVIDLSDLKSLPERCKAAIEIHGRIDILINNAGISHRGKVLDTTIDVDQMIMNVNYFGALAISRAIVSSMVENQSGHVVFVSSIQGKIALPFRHAYAASKHAIQALADSLRAEVASSGILVTTVHPGYVKTNLSLNALTGTGEKHGQMDATTEKGYEPDYVAQRIFKAVLCGEKEVFICSYVHRAAVFLRLLCPRTFFYLMAWRANRFQ